MSITATASLGTAFKLATTPITQIKDIDGPSIEVVQADVTCLGSTAKEYVGVITDGGTISANIVWDSSDTSHQLVAALFTSKATDAFTLTYADTSTLTGNCNISKLEIAATPEDVLVASVEFKVTGAVTFTEPS